MFEESRIVSPPPTPALETITGEPYQPVRIYYQVRQKNAVIGRFKRLKCINFDKARNCWIWLYTEEAKNLKFDCSYRDLPKFQRPVILGYFTFKGDSELQLDVDSFEWAIAAIDFFDSKINRRLAKLHKLKLVNKLFSETTSPEELSCHHTVFFDQHQAVNSKEQIQQIDYESENEISTRQNNRFKINRRSCLQISCSLDIYTSMGDR